MCCQQLDKQDKLCRESVMEKLLHKYMLFSFPCLPFIILSYSGRVEGAKEVLSLSAIVTAEYWSNIWPELDTNSTLTKKESMIISRGETEKRKKLIKLILILIFNLLTILESAIHDNDLRHGIFIGDIIWSP